MNDIHTGNSEYDLSYMLESADGRLADACPFTEDTETEKPEPDDGTMFVCGRCGGVFPKKIGWVQKYCHPCGAERKKERERERYYRQKENPVQKHQNKRVYPAEAFAALGEAARSLGINTSAPAPKAKKESIEEINRLARDAGMSYGQYVALMAKR